MYRSICLNVLVVWLAGPCRVSLPVDFEAEWQQTELWAIAGCPEQDSMRTRVQGQKDWQPPHSPPTTGQEVIRNHFSYWRRYRGGPEEQLIRRTAVGAVSFQVNTIAEWRPNYRCLFPEQAHHNYIEGYEGNQLVFRGAQGPYGWPEWSIEPYQTDMGQSRLATFDAARERLEVFLGRNLERPETAQYVRLSGSILHGCQCVAIKEKSVVYLIRGQGRQSEIWMIDLSQGPVPESEVRKLTDPRLGRRPEVLPNWLTAGGRWFPAERVSPSGLV